MTDAQFIGFTSVIGVILTAFFSYLTVRYSKRVELKGSVAVAEIVQQSAFVKLLMERLEAVELGLTAAQAGLAVQIQATHESEKRFAEQVTANTALVHERGIDKAEIASMKTQIDALRRTNRRQESRIAELEKRLGTD